MTIVYMIFALALVAEMDEPLTIQPSDDARRVTVVARLAKESARALSQGPLDVKAGESLLRFSLVGMDGRPGPPMFGAYRLDGHTLSFVPRYRLANGERYRATLLDSPATLIRDYRVPARKRTPPAVVEAIYPSGDVLPANLMKFYIHFSKPMREGRAIFDRVKLVDEEGRSHPDAWRRTELWTADARRFTLWIHPGRVKRGVNLREEFGPVLAPGKRYKLIVTAQVQDADGQPLGREFIKSFRTSAEDHDRPLPQNWKVVPPKSLTRQPLAIRFSEPLDRALARRCIDIMDRGGKPVAGEVSLLKNESVWQFRPRGRWRAEEYKIVVSDVLEDLAGNTPARVFDTDLTAPRGEPPRLVVNFHPRE